MTITPAARLICPTVTATGISNPLASSSGGAV
jgi:hypothetical protein